MSITVYTEEEIANQALAFLRNRFAGKDSSTESFLGKIARAFAMTASGIQQAALAADNDSVPSAKNSTTALETFAYVFGVPSSTAGQYGRKGATTSGGGVGLSTGTNGTSFPAGTQLIASDGSTVVAVVTTVTIPGVPPGAGSVSTTFRAVTAGTAGNLAAGQVLTWISAPTGADPTVTLTTALSGAIDQETAQDLLARILLRLQQPPKGGVASDYRQWSESLSGVDRSYVYPLRGGIGTVHIVITGPGSGTGRNPGSLVKTTVDNYINGSSGQEGTRPVTTKGYKSYLPYQPGNGLNIRVRVVPNGTANAFDWVDTAASYTVLGYTAPGSGNPARLQLSAIPSSLSSAMSAGRNPRLQILSSTSGAPTNEQISAVSIFSGTTVNLIDPLPSNFVPPIAGDIVYAGGPVVDTISAALLAYVDSLGPSRQSGYVDTLDVWEDTLALARLIQVSLDQTDDQGKRLALNTLSGGVTIDGATLDVQATDNSNNGPQLLFARWISVTQ